MCRSHPYYWKLINIVILNKTHCNTEIMYYYLSTSTSMYSKNYSLNVVIIKLNTSTRRLRDTVHRIPLIRSRMSASDYFLGIIFSNDHKKGISP